MRRLTFQHQRWVAFRGGLGKSEFIKQSNKRGGNSEGKVAPSSSGTLSESFAVVQAGATEKG